MAERDQKREIEELLQQADPQILSSLPKDKRDRLLDALPRVASVLVERHSFYSGPLPPAGMLEEYNRIIPNGAERIMAMAELQSEHRRLMEKEVISSQNLQSKRGQMFAFIIAILLIGVGTTAILFGHSAVASTIFGTTVLGLVTVFVLGRKSQQSDLSRKNPD